jgi:hypothetical protein
MKVMLADGRQSFSVLRIGLCHEIVLFTGVTIMNMHIVYFSKLCLLKL